MRVSQIGLNILVAVALIGLVACERGDGLSDAERKAAARAAEMEAARVAYEKALTEAQASQGEGQPAMWTLADEDTTLYIMGTVHLLRPDLDWRSDEIDQVLDAADTLVFEADVTSLAAQQEMMRFISLNGNFTDGRQLTSLLDEIEKAELEKALKHVGLPLGAVQPMKPWWAAMNMSVLQIKREGFDPNSGVEMVLEAEGRADGKSFAYLETIEEQLGRFATLPEDVQVDFLISSAESIEEGGDVLDTLVSEWADGDVNGIGVLMANPEMMGSDEVYDALLRKRNEDWVGKIEAMLDEPGTRLIAVGAGHLAGPDSVIVLLEKNGHEVTGP